MAIRSRKATRTLPHVPLVLLAFLCVRCPGAHVFSPATPHRCVQDDIEVELTAFHTESGWPYEGTMAMAPLRIEAKAPLLFVASRLSPAESPPCKEGVIARRMHVPDFSRLAGSSLLGKHEIHLRFLIPETEEKRLFGDQRPVLDILVARADDPEDTRCIRVPVLHELGRVEWEERPSWYMGFRTRFLWAVEPVSGVNNSLQVLLRGGKRFGPLRLHAEAGLGSADAIEPFPTDVEPRRFWLFAGAALADFHLFSVGGLGINMELGYEFNVPLGLKAGVSRYIHGPRAALRFSGMSKRLGWTGFLDSYPDSMFLGIEIFSTIWWGEGGYGPTPVFGLSLAIDGGVP